MSGIADLIFFSIATILGVAVVGIVVVWFIQDVTQKKHSILRNYPVIGRLRYFFEIQGKYFRQYFFANDRDEMPFNRATRGWIY
ncbi:MAG: FMN-binding glutamate synthase family protein, partial [Nitrosomonadaceae bacterium]|nr:FMN-binding glutamate synthase family protein [Nitrosomonadaceae bacterium]